MRRRKSPLILLDVVMTAGRKRKLPNRVAKAQVEVSQGHSRIKRPWKTKSKRAGGFEWY